MADAEILQFRTREQLTQERRLRISDEIAHIAVDISLLEGRRAQLERELRDE